MTFLEEVFCKLKIIGLQGGFNDGVFGLKKSGRLLRHDQDDHDRRGQ